MTIMSLPNEFMGLGAHHSIHPDNVASLVIPSAHSNSNFASTQAANNVAQFCGTGFFPNTLGYELPFMNAQQRPAHFNSPFLQQNKHQPEVSSKDEIAQLAVNRTNSFNNDVSAQSAYWPRQAQVNPFGFLSHEIPQVEEKSAYDNVLSAHYLAQTLNMNQMSDNDKKAQPKKDSPMKKVPQSYTQQKSMADMKMFQMQDEMGYRNGVLPKLDQGKLTNYKKMANEVVSESAAARDYRTFKTDAVFNVASPVVRYTGKGSKQFSQKAAKAVSAVPPIKNQRGVSCSPLMAQKMDFHRDDSRSSPLSSDDNMSEQMRYSSPNSIKDDAVYHGMNTMNNVCHSTLPVIPNYRDHQDMNCHMNGNKNKVTNQFAKLPTNASNNGAVATDTSQLNRKASFTSPYTLFNNQLQAKPDKPERVEPQVVNTAAKMAMHNDVNAMLLPKQSPNGSVGYSSVIMRTDRTYETDDKMEKIRQQRQQPPLWPNESLKADKSYKPELSAQGQRNLLMGLTERQQSYFDNSSCQVTQNMRNSTKNPLKPMYDGQHSMEQMPQEQLHYQQYMPVKLATPVQSMLESTDLAEKSFSRKRRSPKTPEYQQSRDPPPAHIYQQQMQPYLMENANRYEVPNQYYSQNNMQSFNNQQPQQQEHHQNTSMTSPAISRMSSPMQTHTLSSYFATAQPNNQYSPSDYQVPSSSYADPMQYQSPEVPAYVPNVVCEPPVEERPKVVVPDVEDEFKFLFDPSIRHYKEIARPAEEEAMYRNKSAMLYRNNKIDFLTSYMNFLENNCESVESLSDANSVAVKTWNRTKVAYQPLPTTESRDDPKPKPAPPKEPVKAPVAATKEPECNFENDPRYYPLPKSSDKRRLDSSSEDEFDGMSKKSKTEATRKSSGEKPKKKVTFKKDIKTVRLIESGKKKVKSSDGKKKTKSEEKAKLSHEKSKKSGAGEKVKHKVEKPVEVKVKPAVVPPKKRSTKDSSKDTPVEVPRRKVSDRKAKDDVKSKIKGAMDSDDELQSSSDSDPSWTPREDDEESSKRRSSKMRSVRMRVKSSRKSSDPDFEDKYVPKKAEAKDSSSESSKGSRSSEKSTKPERYYILKNQVNSKYPMLWKLEGEKLQKFEPVDLNGGQCFASTSVTVKLSEFGLHKYQEVEVSVVQVKSDKTFVELCDETAVPTDFKIKENFMKESRCYETQFSVYIQTLVSQALDSNFLNEIAKENDVYFLNNMKVIDDVTSTYLVDLTAVVKWGSSSIETSVKTWPFVSMNKSESTASKKCAACQKSSCKKTAVFYGQPYQRDTLQGCNSIPNNLDKTTDLCGGCAREIVLFNKIWHQKYHVFVECAKYVSKKKADDKNKSTTDILNELLADSSWLAKLFYDIRNVWLQIWTIVQKLKGS